MTEYERDRQRRLGQRGNPIFQRETETTDLDDMRERSVEEVGACYCGRPVTEESIRRCVACNLVCCESCEVIVRRRVFCQTCAEQGFGLDKPVFINLHLIDQGAITARDLVQIDVDETGEPVEVRINETARPLIENGYITDEGSLTQRGREALHIGRQLFGADDDVQQLMQDMRIEEVANQ